MSEQYLSQDEIDALLDAPEGSATDAPADAAPGAEAVGDSGADTAATKVATDDRSAPQPYDLARQERIIRGRMPALELIHERFARSLGLAMFAFMQRNPEITHSDPVVGRYSDFLGTIQLPASINIMQTRPLAGSALLVLDGQLVSTIVDLMFGGTGRPMRKSEGRELLMTEKRLIQKLIDLSSSEYSRAWESIHLMELVFTRSESQS